MAKHDLFQSAKFRILCRRLGEPAPHMAGHLEYLWQCCHARTHPFLGDEEMVEAAAEWDGLPGQLCQALATEPHNWIDRLEDGSYVCHDYWEHCPQHVIDRAAKRLHKAGRIEGYSREEVVAAWEEEPWPVSEIEEAVTPRREQSRPVTPGRDQASLGGPQPKPKPQPKKREVSDETSSSPGGDPAAFVAAYSELAKEVGLPIPSELTEARKKSIRARLRQHGPGAGAKVLEAVRGSPFLQGIGGRDSWRGATLDWLIKPGNWAKVLEGNYPATRASPRPGSAKRPTITQREEELVRHIVEYANAVRKAALSEEARVVADEFVGRFMDLGGLRLAAGPLEARFFEEYDRFHLALWKLTSSNGDRPPTPAELAKEVQDRYGLPNWSQFDLEEKEAR